MEIEGELVVKYGGNCDDLINILLTNGYTLTIETNKDKDLRVLYYKNLGGKHGC